MNKIGQLSELAKEYVEMEASTTVKSVEYIQTFKQFNKEVVVFLVNSNGGEFWVVGGGFPMNLYDKRKFPTADEAFSFHLGLMLRMSERQPSEEGSKSPNEILRGSVDLVDNPSTKEIVEFIENRKDYFYPSWEERKDTPFEITPTQFLEFAKEEIREGIQEGYLNALSNIKRAIDCQLDLLLYVLGQYKKAKSKDWSFPTKIEFIRSIGLVAPEILTKINRKRNQLEHEYKYPGSEEVKDALDIGNLFLAYTSKFTKRRYLGFGIELSRGELWISFDQGRNRFEIEILDPPSKHVIDDKDENFSSLLKIYVELLVKL